MWAGREFNMELTYKTIDFHRVFCYTIIVPRGERSKCNDVIGFKYLPTRGKMSRSLGTSQILNLTNDKIFGIIKMFQGEQQVKTALGFVAKKNEKAKLRENPLEITNS